MSNYFDEFKNKNGIYYFLVLIFKFFFILNLKIIFKKKRFFVLAGILKFCINNKLNFDHFIY